MKLNSIEEWTAKIVAAMEQAGLYAPAKNLEIYALASDFATLDMANAEIAGLDATTVITPQGLKAHPAFGIQRHASASISAKMKGLGLTAEMLATATTGDPMVELTAQLLTADKADRRKAEARRKAKAKKE